MATDRKRKAKVRFFSRETDRLSDIQDSYRIYFEQNPAGIYLASVPNGIIENCNEAFARMLGYDSILDLLGQNLSSFFVDSQLYQNFLTLAERKQEVKGNQQFVRRTDDSKIWVLQDFNRIANSQSEDHYVLGTVLDITPQKQKEEEFVKNALYDSLTGLPNRSLFLDRLGVCYDRARRDPNYQFAVLFLDLDRFKWINDSFGHRVGDELLVAAAKRLNSKIRGVDTVARLSGDEFAILVGEVRDISDATRVASRIQYAFQNPFRLGERELYITVSIGIALSSGQWFTDQEGEISPIAQTSPAFVPLDCPEDLLWGADAVLYRAKQLGRARFEIFDAEMQQKVSSIAQLELDLRNAVEQDQFVNHYQPIVSLVTGRIIGFEACLRWQHPSRGILQPGQFSLLAEQIGLHNAMDRMFVKRACTQLQEFRKEFSKDEPFISLNLSVSAFHDSEFVSMITNLLRSFDLGKEHLWFELSESSLLEHFEGIHQALNQLRSIGISIAVDDFGTGFSSLKGLPQFPVDVLKVDSSLISGMNVDEMYVDVVGTLIALGHSLGFSIFAEGVETQEQILELKRLGCDGAQGSYFSDAVDAASARALLYENDHKP
jgi:diguanylate cyclase (GGDEF)-like protein/PAS domain S-box-containing protein